MKRILTSLFILMAMASAQLSFAQTHVASGRVLGDDDQGIINAGVSVKGTTLGTVTDFDGNYKINVPDDARTLVIQATGYAKQEVTAAAGSRVVKMVREATSLRETVVTALGITREKRSLGYTQTTVSSADIERSGDQNTIEALAGKSAGILVTGSGGTPGASSQIILRGNGNMNGVVSQPLFVVDGIPIDNGTSQPVAGDYPYDQNLTGVNESNRGIDLNPNDIESVSILRGPAAAALYGINGGNGAIIITTKKGRFGKGAKKLGVDFSSTLEYDKVSNLPAVQNVFVQGTGGKYSTSTNQSFGPRADTSNIPIYDKYKNFFNTGVAYTNNLGLSWGTENSTFRIGLGNTKNTGVVPNSQLNRTTVNFRAESKLADYLSVGGDFNYTNTAGKRVQNGSNLGGIMLTLLRAPINYNVLDYQDALGNETQYFSAYDNPLFSANRNPYTDVTNRVFGNIHAALTLAKGLTLTNRLGVDQISTNAKQIFDISSVADDNNDGAGQINLYNSSSMSIYNDLILNYDHKLSKDVDLSGLLGFNYTYDGSQSTFSRGRNIQIPGIYQLSNTNDLYASSLEGYSRGQGAFGQVTLGYKSQLYLTATGRNDWTSSYGRNGQSFFYPNADLAWIFTDVLPKNSILNYGKIRAAYADAGTGPVGYLNHITFTQPFITDGYTNGVGFPYLGNQGFGPSNTLTDVNIKPQHVQSKEIGLELRMFHNRVTFEATGYYQLTLDNIIPLPIAPSTGFSAYYTNGGTSQNKGIELALSIDVLKSKDFKWSVYGNFTMDRSKVLSINPQVSNIPIGNGFSDIGSYSIVGQPVGVFYGTAWERDSTSGKILVDANGKAKVSAESKVIGNPNPDWTMGIGSNFSYKGLSFSFLWDIRHGGDVWNGTWARLNRLGVGAETVNRDQTYTIDGIYAPGTPKAGQINSTPVTGNYYYTTFQGDGGNFAVENSLQDGGWVRLRSVNLSYRFTFNKTTTHNFFDYLEVGFTGKNLLLFTDYKGVDPETSLTGATSAFRGYDYFNNPGVKSYLINVKLGL
ncbi:MAG: SusC/RagA family TonB-linked outer membrane protein [Chitinophagaceae bacterium]